MTKFSINRREVLAGATGLAATTLTPAFAQGDSAAWQILETEPFQGKQDDISFVDFYNGWYGNGEGKLYRTRDGGESWQRVWEQPGTFIRALGFVDENVGFLGNIGTGYYPNVSDTHPLYRTEDGGESWHPVEADNLNVIPGICGIDIVDEEVIFQGNLRTRRIIHAGGRVGGPAAVLRSIDGGESWSVLDLSSHIGMILDVKFFNANEGLICAASSATLPQAEAVILRTQDGGNSWSEAYRSGRPFENCWKMNFPTRSTGYATVQNYSPGHTNRVIIKTTDGGASWSELPLVNDVRAQQFGIGFVDENFGWVGTTQSGYETRDGGQSWSPVDFGMAVNKIRVIHNGNDWRAFAIGVNVSRYIPIG